MTPITNDAITELYTRHSVPASDTDGIDAANLHLLATYALSQGSHISLEDDHIVFNSLGESSPLKSIAIENICGVETMGRHIAIVLSSSIFFVDTTNGQIHIHIKNPLNEDADN